MIQRTDYEAVAAGQTDQICGPKGALQDILERLVVNVTTAATGTVAITDGNGTPIILVPVNTAIGVYSIEIGALAKVTTGTPGWKITTGAGASVLAVGRFT